MTVGEEKALRISRLTLSTAPHTVQHDGLSRCHASCDFIQEHVFSTVLEVLASTLWGETATYAQAGKVAETSPRAAGRHVCQRAQRYNPAWQTSCFTVTISTFCESVLGWCRQFLEPLAR